MNTERTHAASRPTLADVAQRAGVSSKTVSRVVNGEPHVSVAVTARVLRAIADLDYRPDRRARDLAAGANAERLIGFVQDDAATPFFGSVNRGLEHATTTSGLVVLSGSTDADPERERALVKTMIEFRVKGLVVASAEGEDSVLRAEIARGTAVACVDRVLEGAPCDTVVSSNRESTRRAVAHLCGIGHRRIAFLGGHLRVWTGRERHAGYHEALLAHGVDIDPALVVIDVDDVDRAARATQGLLDSPRPPTAIFSAQDQITTGAIIALHERGRQHDIAMFGFDDIPFAGQLSPAISTIVQDPYELGVRAGRLLLDRLADRSAIPARQIVLDAPLCHRQSGDIRPNE